MSSIEVVERVLRRCCIPATVLLAGIIILDIVVGWVWSWDAGFLGFRLLFPILTIALPFVTAIAVQWARSLSGPVGEIAAFDVGSAREWVDQELGRLMVRWGSIVCGILLLIVGFYSTLTSWIGWEGWSTSLFFLWAGIFFFGYGVLVWAFGALMVLIWRISNLPIRCSPFRWPTSQVDAVYSTYFRVLLIGALLYGIAVLSVWVSPVGAQMALETTLGRLWVFPPAVCIILFFLVFHLRIHALLLRFKRASEGELTELLVKEYHEWTRAPDSAREDRIEKLLAWRDHVRKADEWPLRLSVVVITIGTLLIPTIKTIVEIAAK